MDSIVIWTLRKGGPKPSIVTAAVLLLIGNWVRYGGTRANGGVFGVVMLGQILIGVSQPFVLTAPTRYSDIWFTSRGRTSATALASLANPFGGALGQLIGPLLATEPAKIPRMSTVACLPSFFIPSQPPTLSGPASDINRPALRQRPLDLFSRLEFWLIFLPFSVFVGLFNSISSLLNQILQPHGLSETAAGVTGALLILVGLVAAGICSPFVDRYRHYLATIKILTPIIALAYIGFIFAPSSNSVAAPFVVASILGASSFALLPVALEYLVEITYPMSPEVSSTICWAGGQLFGAIFILVGNALKASPKANPPGHMGRALVFQAVIASAVVPFPLCLGLFGRDVRPRRWDAELQHLSRSSS
ncbi:hypothetical protein FQN57_002938 [Myotisia sp. PD_48]|nr:hypothetical protein FQN57_002938 [Myotisia sp. PD_48]